MPIKRRIAAHSIVLPDGRLLEPGCVELDENDHVRHCYVLTGEQAGTTWLGGTVEIRQEGNSQKAYKNNKPI